MKYPDKTSIQNIANTLSNTIKPVISDVFESIQVASDILYACKGLVYNLTKSNKGFLYFASRIKLDDATELAFSQYLYQPPLLCTPLTVTNNNESGYYTYDTSVVLGGKYKEHNKQVRLDVINILNNIKFILDIDTVSQPCSVDTTLTNTALQNAVTYQKQQQSIVKEYMGKSFWFNHRLDSRGRLYCQGYHLNYMGDDYNKAAINLAKHEYLEE